MEICIPKKNDFIVLTNNAISSMGSQKLEFTSRNYPNYHSKLVSFVLKKGEWYQVGSIYVAKSQLFLNLRLQKSKSERLWMKERLKEETLKVSEVFNNIYDATDKPLIKNRSLECLAEDLHNKALVFSHSYEAIKASNSINLTARKNIGRWEQLEV